MKKLMTLIMGIVISLSFVITAFAETPNDKVTEPADRPPALSKVFKEIHRSCL